MLAMMYVVLYSITQFLIFFVRDNIVILFGLKQAQVTAIVVIILTLPVIAYLLRKDRQRPKAAVEVAQAHHPAGEIAREA
jgi:prolipoprotein diacylglyceryltransferase